MGNKKSKQEIKNFFIDAKYGAFQKVSDEEIELIQSILIDGNKTKKQVQQSSPWGMSKTDFIIRDLREKNLLNVLRGEQDTKGRKPFAYQMNGTIGYFLGMEVDIAYDRIVLVDMNGEITASAEFTPSLGEKGVMGTICLHINSFLKSQGFTLSRIWAIGIGTHASFEDSEGIIQDTFNPDGISLNSSNAGFFPLKKHLEENLGIPVFLERPKLLVTMPANHRNIQKSQSNCISVNIGYGTGMAVFIGGKNYQGSSNLSGEIGHITIPGNDKLCFCGNTGCLQTIISYKAICEETLKQMRNLADSGISPSIREDELLGPDYEKGVLAIIRKAQENDKTCMNVITYAASTLGKIIAEVISVFNPDKLLIYSLLVTAGELFSDPLKVSLRSYTFSPSLNKMDMELIPLEPFSVSTGGAFNAREHCFEQIKLIRGK